MKTRKNTVFIPGNAPPMPLPESWYAGLNPRPIFALVIGVDKYQHLPQLHGAVNDADAFSEYVSSNLKVPAESILNLRNEQATRSGILRALTALGSRSERPPRKDDAIIIYYAGYAGQLEAGLNGLQSIVPWDYSAAPENPIPAIASPELLPLLAAVKRTKGDRITIILDCGGSSDKVLESKTGDISSRVITLAETQTEPDLGAATENGVVTGNVFVLSACSKGEAAIEAHGRGLFTSALIKLLKEEGSTNTTRANVLARLPQITDQTPQAHGGITDAPIFDTGLVPPEQIAYPISLENQQYVVHAGSVAGITPGSQFFIYRDRSRLSKKKPKVFVADRISLLTTTLKPAVDGPLKPLLNLPAAIPSGSGQRHDLVVHTVLKDALTPLYQVALKLLYNASTSPYQFLFTEDRTKADISLDVSQDGDALTTTILDHRIALHGYKEIPLSVPLKNDDIETFLLAAAHFYHHLNLSHLNHSLGTDISVEFLKLEESDTHYYENGRAHRTPVGSNLFSHGITEVTVDPDELEDYGFKITNRTDKDLYAHVFYFDNSEFSIANYWPGAYEQAPITKQGGVLTIGYDRANTTSYRYYIPDGQEIDAGFAKVIFSTEPIDVSKVVQDAPSFQAQEGGDTKPALAQSGSGTGKEKDVEAKSEQGTQGVAETAGIDSSTIWGSVMFCIIQRRVPE
ncbi:caspase domain-containing protein [Ephemerocybe angulata]|uniref:Caspase domain-containing protein n=1 Tax=Ephemerocybe angulata TaxID=980116 RepID=A0A8H6I9A4_9AGAR|nr:caspase domain-containing protein [Tulosesus angulatus]